MLHKISALSNKGAICLLKSSSGNSGTVHIRLTRGGEPAPIHNAAVIVGEKGTTKTFLTDGEGRTEFKSEAPSASLSFNPMSDKRPYGLCDIKITAPRIHDIKITGCEVFFGTTTLLNCEVTPCKHENEKTVKEVKIPMHSLWAENPYNRERAETYCGSIQEQAQNKSSGKSKRIDDNIKTPEFVTLHLGLAEKAADNRVISFGEYIKNIASGILYPVWGEEALKAGIICIANLAKYRLYSNYYRNLGFGFDLATETDGCLNYCDGRMIFEPISKLTDRLKDTCLAGWENGEIIFTPYYTSKSSLSRALSVWESAALAAKGMKCAEILRVFFGEGIRIYNTEPDNCCSYDIVNLKNGDNGYGVKLMQRQLNSIALLYPELPFIKDSEGHFGENTEQALKEYQRKFGLPATGISDAVTQKSLSYVSSVLNKYSDGHKENNEKKDKIPLKVLVYGDSGPEVTMLQNMLNIVRCKNGYECVVETELTGDFDDNTRECLNAFQRYRKLPCSGVADKKTWSCLKEECDEFLESGNRNNYGWQTKEYPGSPVCDGSEEENVLYVQKCVNALQSVFKGKRTLPEDGVYGERTKAAVQMIQTMFGLLSGGIVEQKTWDAIGAEITLLKQVGGDNNVYAAEG